jgi:hypothetical protein
MDALENSHPVKKITIDKKIREKIESKKKWVIFFFQVEHIFPFFSLARGLLFSI